uniref:Trafficking protein particle complex subunit n=1 Tax=Mantoniella antarctica TaxID=81844 RepID=A0A7S0SQF2_9CHLO
MSGIGSRLNIRLLLQGRTLPYSHSVDVRCCGFGSQRPGRLHQGAMTLLHSFRIFNKQGACLFRHSWRESAEVPAGENDEDARKMLFGLLFSLKQFVVKMDPREDTTKPCSFHAFRTNNYKLHFLETATGLLFLLTTDPSSPDMKDHLLQCSVIHDDIVVKNPAWDSQLSEYTCAEFLNALTNLREG